MTVPSEICDIHDLALDEYGCWACGHGGPITDKVAGSWYAWSLRWSPWSGGWDQ